MNEPGTALTGTQKVAVVLMNMDRQRATEVMKQFSDIEAEVIAGEIVQLRNVDPAVAESTLNEFHEITLKGRRLSRGGHEFAVGLLEASFGAERASTFLVPVMSSCTAILNSSSVGSSLMDSARVSRARISIESSRPSRESGSTARVYQRLKSWVRR